MKKSVLLLFLLGLMQQGFAQSNQIDNAAEYGADYICTCVNKVYAEVDQDVRDVMMALTIMSEAEIDEYMATLPEEFLMRIVEQGEFMSDENTVAEMDACGQRMEANLISKFGDMSADEDELMTLMISKLEAKEDCEFAYFLLLMGLTMEEDPDDNTVNNNANKKPNPKPNPNNNVNHGGGGTEGQ
jgi:hypothetical protein